MSSRDFDNKPSSSFLIFKLSMLIFLRFFVINVIPLTPLSLIKMLEPAPIVKISYFLDFNTWGFVGLLLGFWIILASIIAIFSSYKIKINVKFFKIINPHIAHIGVGIAIVGITCSSVFQNELDFNLNEGDKFIVNGKTVLFEKIETTNEINFQSLRGKFLFDIEKNKSKEIEAGKNYYPVSKMITSEAGILHQWNKDIYFILGDQKNNEWFVKVLINPFVSFIWLGVIIMMYSGLIAVFRR